MRRIYIVEEKQKEEGFTLSTIMFLAFLLCIFIGLPIVLIYDFIVGPTEREIYEGWGNYENRSVDIQVYQLGGLYNTSKGKDYRVDFIVHKNNKVIKSMYYDDEDKFNKKYKLIPIEGEWRDQDINRFPYNVKDSMFDD
ncbi:hypothetical protein K2W83_02330 [Apilactobacillus kunkeei]|uniref:hypothetical protein n=1 Tax=Apilactobacillus kunkeei TaxID=148814 RepID=UPI0006C16B19|nr:hypothetical protein [Apilactobacillus kunkeei]KOY73245.1 hypothetical protein RZ79_07920 [Apilactobacillus kunkeei DSM 12361 = ATCC 700308]QYU53487.1 hypothetical protein K2W83_02330 [Apilactobacillus kunkeei]